MDLSIRRFAEKDLGSLRQVYLESRRIAFKWLDPESLRLSDFDRDTVGETIWVAEQDGLVIGFVAVQERERFIHHLFVQPSCASQGWGSKLLVASLSAMGGPAHLKCVAENIRALAFYQSKGFIKVAEGVSEDVKYHLLEIAEY